jgi:hypothetical protein
MFKLGLSGLLVAFTVFAIIVSCGFAFFFLLKENLLNQKPQQTQLKLTFCLVDFLGLFFYFVFLLIKLVI